VQKHESHKGKCGTCLDASKEAGIETNTRLSIYSCLITRMQGEIIIERQIINPLTV
jgi:hypothetical protein